MICPGLSGVGFRDPTAVGEEAAIPSRCPADRAGHVVVLTRPGTTVAQLAETSGISEAYAYRWRKQDGVAATRRSRCSRAHLVIDRERPPRDKATIARSALATWSRNA